MTGDVHGQLHNRKDSDSDKNLSRAPAIQDQISYIFVDLPLTAGQHAASRRVLKRQATGE